MKHSDFAIGREFVTATGTWRCTDIDTRTIIAINRRLDQPRFASVRRHGKGKSRRTRAFCNNTDEIQKASHLIRQQN